MTRQNRSADRTADLGSKVGPRIADLVARSVLATRRSLAPMEARALAAGLQLAVDEMGRESAEFMRPITDRTLGQVDMPDDLARMLGRASSGKHQWEARALQIAGVTGATSALGTVLSNYLFPATGDLVSHSPHLVPDPGTLAELAARGMVAEQDATFESARQGFSSYWSERLREAANQYPDLGALLELERRGQLGPAGFYNYLRLNGYLAQTIPLLKHLARVLLTPADAALGVLRGDLSAQEGEAIAAANGIEGRDFQTLLANTGEPLGLQQLQEALRRGYIDTATFARGVRQSRVRNEWLKTAEQLRYSPMPTADAADAALRGHLTIAEAQAIAEQNGLLPDQWPAYYANQGNPPAPEQLLELWRRGYIDEAQVRLGLREGRTRNEWIPQVEQLRYEPISSADAVDAWLRGHIGVERAKDTMSENGLLPRDQDIALANAGNPLGLEELLEAFRRGFIDRDRFITGFRESRYRNEWADTALRLRYRPMSTADAVEAAVQGHLTIEAARDLADQNGLLAADFDALYQTAGSPLSRTEAEELYNRGEISQAEVEQALRESRLKDKYIESAVKLHVRLPEARQVATMVEFGAIGHAEALDLILKLGYPHAIAAAFVAEAEARATGGHRQLATTQVTGLYEQHLIGRADAERLLEQLHYTPASAGMLLQLADHARRMRILDTGLAAVRASYVERHTSDLEASADLAALEIPPDARQLYLQVWGLERKAKVRTLTEAQVVKAYAKGLFDPDPAANLKAACERLAQLGYSAEDATYLVNGA